MKKCPYCAELIQDEAIICRFCNRHLTIKASQPGSPHPPVKKNASSNALIWVIVFIVGLVLIGMCVSNSDKKKTENYTPFSGTQLQNKIDELRASGLLKKIDLGNFYYISPNIWNQLNIDDKQRICMIFADYAQSKGEQRWCEVRDYMTGKKIAKIDAWSFKTY